MGLIPSALVGCDCCYCCYPPFEKGLTDEHRMYHVPYNNYLYEGHSESKERFAIQRYLLIIGKIENMQVLSHTFTYFST